MEMATSAEGVRNHVLKRCEDADVSPNTKVSQKLQLSVNENAQIKHPTTYLVTFLHLLKGNIGSGIFAMGDAFKNAGMAIAPWLVLVLGITSLHTQHILIDASNSMKEKLKLKVQPDFADTVGLCFTHGPPRLQKYARFMQNLIKTFLCMGQLGFCCVYFVFISTNMQQVCDYYGFHLDVHVFMAIIFVPIVGSCMVRSLKFLTPFSIAANVLMGFGIVAVVYYTFRDLPSPSSINLTANLYRYPLFFGTALFAMEGISLVLPLQREMKHPDQFNKPLGVLNVGIAIITFLYILMGTLSYLKYGEEVEGSVTLNLPQDERLSILVKIAISVGILLSYALQFYIPVQIIYSGLSSKFESFSRYPTASELGVRFFFVLLTFILAATVPFLELFISLVGALCSATICLIIPPIIDLVEHWRLQKLSKWNLFKNCLLLLSGVFICFSGSYQSINQIIKAIHS